MFRHTVTVLALIMSVSPAFGATTRAVDVRSSAKPVEARDTKQDEQRRNEEAAAISAKSNVTGKVNATMSRQAVGDAIESAVKSDPRASSLAKHDGEIISDMLRSPDKKGLSGDSTKVAFQIAHEVRSQEIANPKASAAEIQRTVLAKRGITEKQLEESCGN